MHDDLYANALRKTPPMPRRCTLCSRSGPMYLVTGMADRVSCGQCGGHVLLSDVEVERPTSLASDLAARLRRYRWEFQTSRPWISARHQSLRAAQVAPTG